MQASEKKNKKNSNIIDEVGVTNETLTSRGGLALFVRYLSGINIYSELDKRFGLIRKSGKGQEIIELSSKLSAFLLTVHPGI